MELETHYSLRCLLNAQSGLRSTAAELAKLRRRLDKMLREKGMETARPVHDSIVRGKRKALQPFEWQQTFSSGNRPGRVGVSIAKTGLLRPPFSNYGAGLYADADWRFKVCRPASNQR